jgi:glycerophosphoryl diester phosphodiesterase
MKSARLMNGNGDASRDHPQRLLLLGHRGYRARYPENTILAFRAALAAGADGVECDLQRTADGCNVVIHDATVERTTEESGKVPELSLAELQCLDPCRGERIPELGELLTALPPGTYFDLELKRETLTRRDCGPISALLSRLPRDRLMVSRCGAPAPPRPGGLRRDRRGGKNARLFPPGLI